MFVNGVNICYESVGEGFPLIAITGKDSNMDWWHPKAKAALGENRRLIMLDNRGTGRSDAPTEPYGIADMARDVIGLMDELHIEKAHVFGQSMGGMIAQEIAIEYPERVAKLVLCATTCGVRRVFPTLKMIRWLSRKQAAFSPEHTLGMLFTKDFMSANPDTPAALVERMGRLPPNPISMELHKQANRSYDSYKRLHRITAPTLIIHGQKDWVFGPKHARILNDRIADSRLVMFSHAGHGVFTQEFPAVLEQIRRFLG
ncbi:alpha/beta fold hydrolase [Paenibacillus ginsengarvi]|uniref:alpha/beta fold hydrolase n=1 Tax=Paenibacillus ginsengarvi TaxID=400777 RepID=UPI001F02CCEE|nr:alpha/beta fold hydrolase [Paenibacillus ginsengarvi]